MIWEMEFAIAMSPSATRTPATNDIPAVMADAAITPCDILRGVMLSCHEQSDSLRLDGSLPTNEGLMNTVECRLMAE
jgi:hypothetical protein